MENLFDKWKTKIPKYSIDFKENLFKSISGQGVEGEKKLSLGKHFSTNYELYIFAFFLGLYNNEFSPIPEGTKKVDFSHAIQFWGSKTTISVRKDFTILQKYIFAALVSKTDIDFIALDKGEVTEESVIKDLISTMEAYTNGGLILIKEKLEDNPTYFLNPTAFLDMIIKNTEIN